MAPSKSGAKQSKPKAGFGYEKATSGVQTGNVLASGGNGVGASANRTENALMSLAHEASEVLWNECQPVRIYAILYSFFQRARAIK